jgi:predicted dehydrogenase
MSKVRVAVIAYGRSGRNIHSTYYQKHADRFQLVAVADTLEKRREMAAKEHGCDTYADHREMLRRSDIDLVVNAVPSHLHVAIGLEILKAGKNCVIDKPFARMPEEADELIRVANEKGVLLTAFQQSRYAPYYRKIRSVIDSGKLGRIVQVRVAFNNFQRRNDWQTVREFMGGNLLNTGPHPVDQALQLFGSDVTPEVTCHMDSVNAAGDAEDHVILWLRGESRPLVIVEVSSADPFPTDMYRIYAEHGGITGGRNELRIKYFDPQKNPAPELVTEAMETQEGIPTYPSDKIDWIDETWTVPEEEKDLFNAQRAGYYEMLYRVLSEGAPLEVTPEQLRQQAAVMAECRRQNPHIYPEG